MKSHIDCASRQLRISVGLVSPARGQAVNEPEPVSDKDRRISHRCSPAVRQAIASKRCRPVRPSKVVAPPAGYPAATSLRARITKKRSSVRSACPVPTPGPEAFRAPQLEFAADWRSEGGSVSDARLNHPILHLAIATTWERFLSDCGVNFESSLSARSINSSQRFSVSRACLWPTASSSESTSDGLDTDRPPPSDYINSR